MKENHEKPQEPSQANLENPEEPSQANNVLALPPENLPFRKRRVVECHHRLRYDVVTRLFASKNAAINGLRYFVTMRKIIAVAVNGGLRCTMMIAFVTIAVATAKSVIIVLRCSVMMMNTIVIVVAVAKSTTDGATMKRIAVAAAKNAIIVLRCAVTMMNTIVIVVAVAKSAINNDLPFAVTPLKMMAATKSTTNDLFVFVAVSMKTITVAAAKSATSGVHCTVVVRKTIVVTMRTIC